jgi:hypothetical protein
MECHETLFSIVLDVSIYGHIEPPNGPVTKGASEQEPDAGLNVNFT